MAHQYSSSFLFTQLFSLNFSLSSSYFITPFSFWFHTSFVCSLSFSTLFYHLLFSCHSTSFFIFSLFVLFIYLIIFFLVPSLVISLVSFLLYFLCLPYLLFYPIYFLTFSSFSWSSLSTYFYTLFSISTFSPFLTSLSYTYPSAFPHYFLFRLSFTSPLFLHTLLLSFSIFLRTQK